MAVLQPFIIKGVFTKDGEQCLKYYRLEVGCIQLALCSNIARINIFQKDGEIYESCFRTHHYDAGDLPLCAVEGKSLSIIWLVCQ
jgi:hypothetical protein